jgi:hypothetical protein
MADMLYKDNAATLITTTINNVDDPVTVSVTAGNGAKFPTIGVNAQNGQANTFPVVIVRASDSAYEKLLCTARATDTFTLTRAQGGTTKLAFAVGDAMYLGNTKEFFDNFLMTQDAQYGKPHWCGTAGGTANAITVAGSPTVTGLSAGLTLEFIASATSTSSTVTFKPDGVTVKNLKDHAGVLLTAGDIISGGLYRVQYNGAEWRIVSNGPGEVAKIARSSGSRNRVFNGDMRIDQLNAGASVSLTAGAALQWVVDGWYAYCTGFAVIATQGIYALGTYDFIFNGDAGVTGCGFGHRIESLNARGLASGNATLSVVVSNSLLTTMNWAVYYANTENAFGTLAAPTRTLIASGTFTGITSAQQVFSTPLTIPASASNGIEIVFTVGAQASGSWRVTNVQLEPGSIATTFDYQPYATELVKCQRYYETGTYSFSLPISNASVVLSYFSHVDFKVTKFAVPTVTGTQSQGGIFSTTSVNADSMGIGRSDVIANRHNTGGYTAIARIP